MYLLSGPIFFSIAFFSFFDGKSGCGRKRAKNMWAATGRREKAHGRILGFFCATRMKKKVRATPTSVPKRKIKFDGASFALKKATDVYRYSAAIRKMRSEGGKRQKATQFA